jgi:hypothetical protein
VDSIYGGLTAGIEVAEAFLIIWRFASLVVVLSSSSWTAVAAREREKGALLLDVVAVTSGGGADRRERILLQVQGGGLMVAGMPIPDRWFCDLSFSIGMVPGRCSTTDLSPPPVGSFSCDSQSQGWRGCWL